MTNGRRFGLLLAMIATVSLEAPRGMAGNPVTLQLQGEIRTACSIRTPNVAVDLGSVLESGTQTVPFRLYCNAPFSYEIRSQNGALKNPQSQPVPRGFKALIPYTVAIQIPTSTAGIADKCASAELTTRPVRCRLSDSGNGISLDRAASFTISWQDDGALPLAGNYADVISLSFHPRF